MAALPPLLPQLEAALLTTLETPVAPSLAVVTVGSSSIDAATSAAPGASAATGAAGTAPSSAGPTPLTLGRLVVGQVIAPTSEGRVLLAVAGRAYDVSIPVDVETGQRLNLQVSQTSPTLELRLLTDAAQGSAGGASSATVSLSAAALTRQTAASNPDSSPGARDTPQPLAVSVGPEDSPRELADQMTQALQRIFNLASPASAGADAAALPGGAVPTSPSSTTTNAALLTPSAASAAGATASLAAASSEASASASASTSGFATGPAGANSAASLVASPSAALAGTPAPAAATASASQASSLAATPGANASAVNGAAAPLLAAALHIVPWPGQPAQLEIAPDDRASAWSDPGMNRWRARIALSLPNSGSVQAFLTWSTAGVSVTVEGQDAATVESLRASSPQFSATLQSLDMRLLALRVRHG
jgi:hypothetical protein